MYLEYAAHQALIKGNQRASDLVCGGLPLEVKTVSIPDPIRYLQRVDKVCRNGLLSRKLIQRVLELLAEKFERLPNHSPTHGMLVSF